ncbi:hypothetical protein ACFY12_12205 [Streptomyces sp. NPDC001339]|uniref:hypothetical protein n=1 Tax=Streptomyces sp. NPDC001339 TaxID=3364563 RepID=UPI0036BFF361
MAQHSPERTTTATEEAFHLRFLIQSVAPDAQTTEAGEAVHPVDVHTGSAAPLTPEKDDWAMREAGR